MANAKFVKTAAAVALGTSVVATAVAPSASAATTYKIKSGKLVNAKTGKVVKGFKTYKKVLYKNGKKYTGTRSGKYYKKGVLSTGTYKGVKYQKGLKFTGISKANGKFYKNGVVGTGTYKGVKYKKGVEFTGVSTNGKYYENGVVATGTKLVDGTLYTDGVKDTKTQVFEDTLFVEGTQATADQVFEDTLYVAGKIPTAELTKFEEKYYDNKGKLANGEFTVDGKKVEIKDGVVVEEAEIASSKAVNTKTIEVQYTTEFDAAATDYTVTKDGVKLNIAKVTTATDKKSAQIELTSKLTKGDYEVSVKPASAEKALTTKVAVADEAIETVSILADKAAVSDKVATQVEVGYQVTNQYGEDITTSALAKDITATAAVKTSKDATLKVTDAKLVDGKVTLTFDKAPQEGDTVQVILVDTKTAKTVTKTVTISSEAVASSVEVGAVTNKDGKTLSVDSDLTKDEFYLPLTVKDQYGNAVTDEAEAAKELQVTNTNSSVVEFDDIKTITKEDGTKQLVLPIKSVKSAGSVVALVIATSNGANATGTVTVAEGLKIASATLADPAGIVTANSTVLFPLTVTNTKGETVTSLKEFNSLKAKNAVVVSTGSEVVEKDGALYLQATVGAENTPYTAYVIVDGKNSTKIVTPKAQAVAKVITGISDKVATAIRAGKTVEIANTDLVVEDQYGQKLSKEDLAKVTFVTSVTDEDAKTLTTVDATDKKSTVITATNTKDTAKTAKVTFTLDGTNQEDSALAKSFSVVKDADFADYTVADLATVQVSGKKGAYAVVNAEDLDLTVNAKDSSNNVVALTKDTDYTVAGLEEDKIKALTFAEGSDTAKLTATVTINATGQQFTKEVTFSKEASKVQTLTFVEKGTAATETAKEVKELTITGTEFDTTALLAAADIEAVDQFNKKSTVVADDVTNLTLTKVSGDVTFTNNGLVNAKAAVEAGKEAVINAKVTVDGKTSTIKVTIKPATTK